MRFAIWRDTLLVIVVYAAAIVALLVGWTLDPGVGLVTLAAPVACFGLPGALIRGVRTPDRLCVLAGADCHGRRLSLGPDACG